MKNERHVQCQFKIKERIFCLIYHPGPLSRLFLQQKFITLTPLISKKSWLSPLMIWRQIKYEKQSLRSVA